MEGAVVASAPTIDVEELLAPIPGVSPSGISLRYDAIYDAIKEARRSDDELPSGEENVWVSKAKVADWKLVVKLATEALKSKSKDLQLSVWLLEALLKQHGFAGIRDGLKLIRGLHERYWDSYFPRIEDGDVDLRCAPIQWLNAKVPLGLRSVPLTGRRGGDNYSWLRWEESRTVENLARRASEALETALSEGKLSPDLFEKAVNGSPRSFYEQLAVDITQVQEESSALDKIIDDRFGRDAPSLNELKKAIEDCATLIESLLKKKRAQEPDPVTQGQGVTGMKHGELELPTEGLVSFDGSPGSRAEALKRLASVAAYFRRTEPHSPVAYLVQRAVQWGDMSLEAWLQDVINSEEVLLRVKETLGLKSKAE